MVFLATTGACKKRLKLVDVDDDKKTASATPSATPPPVAQNDPPPAPAPADPPPAATEEQPPIIPAAAKVPVSPTPKPLATTTAKPAPAPPAPITTTSAKTASGKTFAPTCSGTCEKALKCMNAYSEVEHASCVVECSSHPVNRDKLAELNSKDCATLVAMLKKK